jgi:hypothetical protein
MMSVTAQQEGAVLSLKGPDSYSIRFFENMMLASNQQAGTSLGRLAAGSSARGVSAGAGITPAAGTAGPVPRLTFTHQLTQAS